MKVFLGNLIKKYTEKRFHHHKVIVKNIIKRNLYPKVEHKFLFILSPPNCGSTLLNEIISTSKFASTNNKFDRREGQTLPLVKKVMFQFTPKRRWDESLKIDWVFVKQEWMKYWDVTKPILLEKSPPNILRVNQIIEHFNPSYFIVFYRNPYAHCESLMRRRSWKPGQAAAFALKCLAYQKTNIEATENFMPLSYEELTESPEKAVEKIKDFLPELGKINVTQKFTAHNYKGKNLNIQNLNPEKIAKLTKHDLEQINKYFKPKQELLQFFNYPIIE